jgi:hypothetical protein
MRHILGPMNSARNTDPIAAEPFHHHALMPSWYPSPVAPTVAPAPMFDASTVVKISGALSRRPATKKSALPRTNRATIRPVAISPTE